MNTGRALLGAPVFRFRSGPVQLLTEFIIASAQWESGKRIVEAVFLKTSVTEEISNMDANGARGISRRAAIRFTGAALGVSAVPTQRAFAAAQGTQSTGDPGTGINVKSFGAQGDANEDGSTGTDDTAAIQSALDYMASIGGGTLRFPEGNYKISSFLTVPAFVTLIGTGRMSSSIIGVHPGGGGSTAAEDVRNGSILYSAFPINTTSAAHIQIEKLRLHNPNGANQGAGFYQQSGDTICLRDCEFTGSKYGVILDQSEDVLIEFCDLTSPISGGAGIWLVNGAALTAGALGQFTNAVTLIENHYNVAAESYGILDDGGVEHLVIGGDFNGGLNGVRMCGTVAAQFVNSYFEGQASDCINLSGTTSYGDSTAGGSSVIISGGFFSASSHAAVGCATGAGSLTITGGYFAGGASPISGSRHLWQFIAGGYTNTTQAPFTDDTVTQGGPFVDLSNLRADGKIGVPNSPGVNGGITLTPGPEAGYIETFNSAGKRQGYGFLLNGSALQFAAQAAATSFQFLDPVSCTGSITSTGGGIGYGEGAGGAKRQNTSKSTGVTLNKPSGQITMDAEALAASTTVSFQLTNSMVDAGDLLILNHVSGGTPGSYSLNAHGSAEGSVTIDVTNITANTLAEGVVIGFAVIKAVTT